MTELQKAWLEALRGHKYTQGRGALRPTDDSYCCLGVLCDIASPTEWNRCTNPYPGFPKWRFASHYGDMPKLLQAQLCIDDMLAQALVYWNDTEKLSFAEIADKLETYWRENQ